MFGSKFSIGHTVASEKMDFRRGCAQKCKKYGDLAQKIFENICEQVSMHGELQKIVLG